MYSNMQKVYNKEDGKTTWQVSEWWQKTMYVVGWIAFYYLAFSFLVGFIIGVASF